VVTKAQRRNIRKVGSTVRSLDISLLIVLIFRKRNQRRSPRNQLSNPKSTEDISSRV